ncbi:hypothetical protein B0T10DRAFT_587319 [Thelonectria olida]|uniref:Fungal N-terminal domain-containing protein n=1 Tax=Thelonectria olida TaxID=1576542 RepID=A0A9P8WBZ9_9HYPO|nr:hypothetical protein B0T10DRAFT_587319 [Thelonectria olida]
MDPVSIAFSCLTLIEVVGRASTRICGFVKGCCDAEEDLAAINRELVELTRVLKILENGLQNEVATGQEESVLLIIDGCTEITETINTVLDEHDGKISAVKWTLDGKKQVQELQAKLEGHRHNLILFVGTLSFAMARTIREDTRAIKALLLEGMNKRRMDSTRDESRNPVPPIPSVTCDVDSVAAVVGAKVLEYPVVPRRQPYGPWVLRLELYLRSQIYLLIFFRYGIEETFQDRLRFRRAQEQAGNLMGRPRGSNRHIRTLDSLLARKSDPELRSCPGRFNTGPKPRPGEWEFVLPWATNGRDKSDEMTAAPGPEPASKVLQRAVDDAMKSLPFCMGAGSSPQPTSDRSHCRAELANVLEVESKPETGAVSPDGSVAAIFAKDMLYFFDTRPMRGELTGHLDFRPSPREVRRNERRQRDSVQQPSRSEVFPLVQFLATDGSLVMATHRDSRKEIFHTKTQTLLKTFSAGHEVWIDGVALDANTAAMLVCEEPANRRNVTELRLVGISNLSKDAEVPNVSFTERVIYQGMEVHHRFKLSPTGRSAVILPTTPGNVRAHPVILLRLDGNGVEKCEMHLPFPDWIDNRHGFILRSCALTDDTFVMVTAPTSGHVVVKAWDLASETLKYCREIEDPGSIFLTQDGRFAWTSVDRHSPGWTGVLLDLSSFGRVNGLCENRRFFFQGSSTVMSRSSMEERSRGPYRVEIHDIVESRNREYVSTQSAGKAGEWCPRCPRHEASGVSPAPSRKSLTLRLRLSRTTTTWKTNGGYMDYDIAVTASSIVASSEEVDACTRRMPSSKLSSTYICDASWDGWMNSPQLPSNQRASIIILCAKAQFTMPSSNGIITFPFIPSLSLPR